MALCLEIKPNEYVTTEEMDRLQETTFFIIFAFLMCFGGSTQFLLRKLEITVGEDAPEDALVPDVEEAVMSTTSRFVRRASRFIDISVLPREEGSGDEAPNFTRRQSTRRATRRSIKPTLPQDMEEEGRNVAIATASSPPATFFSSRSEDRGALRLEGIDGNNPRERATFRTVELEGVEMSRIAPTSIELPGDGASSPGSAGSGSSSLNAAPSALKKMRSENRRTVKISPVVNFQSFSKETYSDTVKHPARSNSDALGPDKQDEAEAPDGEETPREASKGADGAEGTDASSSASVKASSLPQSH